MLYGHILNINVLLNSFSHQVIGPISFLSDPLEQFEVVSFPLLSCLFYVTNLSVVLLLNWACIYFLLSSYSFNLQSNYDFILKSIYNLVRSVVKENLTIRKQQYFLPTLYLFFMLLAANLVGLLPYSFTATSSFILTLFISLTSMSNVVGTLFFSHGWRSTNLFLPSGVPLAITPFLVFIEAVSFAARVLSLSIRLFANMMSGHALLKILIGFSWAMLSSASPLFMALSIVPWLIVTAVMFLELLIAFLQAYVFTILVVIYINDVLSFHS
jgi:F-type H+-transporting ATPase subunit a